MIDSKQLGVPKQFYFRLVDHGSLFLCSKRDAAPKCPQKKTQWHISETVSTPPRLIETLQNNCNLSGVPPCPCASVAECANALI